MSDKLKGNNVVDDDFSPSEDFQDTDEDFQGTKKDDENFPSSGDFENNEDDYNNGGHNVDDVFPPNEDFQGTDDDAGKFSPSENFNGIDSLMGDDDFPSSEYFHERSNDIGEDGNYFSSEFYIPLINDIIN